MVTLAYLRDYYNGKKVFLTGHTGFKGSWLLQILALCGAQVKGYSLAPAGISLYHQIDGDTLNESIIADIRDAKKLKQEILDFAPDYIFHLAAQPLVLEAYENPLYTFEVNTQGTANIMEAIRHLPKACVCIMITTDKVYENNDGNSQFVETDKLGGYDPYSASKAACEIVISSYRNSFFNNNNFDAHKKSIAAMRAGNVIGGGDYAPNRIIPDIINAIQANEKIVLRNPHATRPWQHVLEPLSVYLLLGTKMSDNPTKYNTAYNIGPEKEDEWSVEALTKIAIATAGEGAYTNAADANKPHEAATLQLNNTKVKQELQWQPVYNATQAITKTVEWYLNTDTADVKCLQQINDYFANSINDSNES
jgi:CDP-glucose 4,6-dehydratase